MLCVSYVMWKLSQCSSTKAMPELSIFIKTHDDSFINHQSCPALWKTSLSKQQTINVGNESVYCLQLLRLIYPSEIALTKQCTGLSTCNPCQN